MEYLILILVIYLIFRGAMAYKLSKHKQLLNYVNTHLRPDLKGKTVFISGGNRGIGLSTAAAFCIRGARVIIGCRSEENALGAIKNIKRLCPNSKIEHEIIDFMDLKSLYVLADKFKKEKVKIDFLINNAAAMVPYAVTNDGFEAQFQVNYLGHFLLTRLFLKNRTLSSDARIVNVSSAMHKYANLDMRNIQKKQNKVMTYNNTKLMNILFSNELSKILFKHKSSIRSISLHPGVIYTDFQNHFVPKYLYNITRKFVRVIASDASKGAYPILQACFSKNLDTPFVYLDKMNLAIPHKNANPNSDSVQKNMKTLWDYSSDLLKIDKDKLF